MEPEFKRTAIEADDTYHHYTGNRIPWFVRLIWIGFWVLAIVYTIRFLLWIVDDGLLTIA